MHTIARSPPRARPHEPTAGRESAIGRPSSSRTCRRTRAGAFSGGSARSRRTRAPAHPASPSSPVSGCGGRGSKSTGGRRRCHHPIRGLRVRCAPNLAIYCSAIRQLGRRFNRPMAQLPGLDDPGRLHRTLPPSGCLGVDLGVERAGTDTELRRSEAHSEHVHPPESLLEGGRQRHRPRIGHAPRSESTGCRDRESAGRT